MLRTSWRAVFLLLSCAGLRGSDDGFPQFTGETSVSLGYGYAENALYSEVAPIDAPYLLAAFEGYLERALLGAQLDWKSMAFWEQRRFESGSGVPDQALVLVQSQVEGYAGLSSKWRIGGRYLGLQQAFDATFDALEQNSFLVDAKEPEILLGWESFFWTFEYDAELGLSRMEFQEEGSDYDSLNWEIELSQRLGQWALWKSEFFGYDRDYADRVGRRLTGEAVVGGTLRMKQLGVETGLEFRGKVFSAEHTLGFKVGARQREDGSFGYYDRSRVSGAFRWRAEWERASLLLQMDYGEQRYEHQLGDDDRPQASHSWSGSLELDRKLSRDWGLFMWVAAEDEDSNASFLSYQTRTVSMGLRWRK